MNFNITNDMSEFEIIDKITKLSNNNQITSNNMQKLICDIMLSHKNSKIYRNSKKYIFTCLLLITKNILPDDYTMKYIITKIFTNPISEEKEFFCRFIDDMFNKGFNFTSSHLILLLYNYYYIDPTKALNTNRIIDKKTLGFLFTKIGDGNLDNIKIIMKKYNLSLNKTCFNNMMKSCYYYVNANKINQDELIGYIKLFLENKIIFDDDNIIKILNYHYFTDMDYGLQQKILDMIDGKITEKFIIKFFCDKCVNYQILNIYFNNNANAPKIKISNNNLKRILTNIFQHHRDDVIKLLFNLTDFTIDYDIIQFLKTPELKFSTSIIELFESKSNIIQVENEESQFIKYLENYDIDNIKKMIYNKFIPKVEYLYYLTPLYKNYKLLLVDIISIFLNLGLIINEEIYTYLYSISGEELNIPNISVEFKKNIKNKINYKRKSFYTNCNNIKSIEYVRELFLNGDITDIINYEYSDFIIKPDDICFSNALHNKHNIMNYIFVKYKYKPTLFDILTVKSVEIRIYLFNKFYQDHLLYKNK
jgi:hypothetical protein